MTHTEQAIQDAIEGGYDPKMFGFANGNWNYKEKVIFLDPDFWKALGKTREWENPYCWNLKHKMRVTHHGSRKKACNFLCSPAKPWLYQATRYFQDYAMKGRSLEEYYEFI